MKYVNHLLVSLSAGSLWLLRRRRCLTLADSSAAVASFAMRCDAGWQETGADFVGKAAVFAWCPLLCELLSMGKGNKLNKPAHNHIPNISKRVWSSHSEHICRESNGRLYGLLDPLINLLSFVQFLWFCLPLFTATAIATPIFAGLCQFMGPDFFVGYIGSKSLLPKFLSHWDRWKAADGSEFHWDMNLALSEPQG